MAKRDLKSMASAKQKTKSDPQMQAADMMKQAEQLRGSSDAQLMEQLRSQIAMEKQNGNFDAGTLKQFIDRVSPMLNAEQRQRLYEITDQLK